MSGIGCVGGGAQAAQATQSQATQSTGQSSQNTSAAKKQGDDNFSLLLQALLNNDSKKTHAHHGQGATQQAQAPQASSPSASSGVAKV